MSVQYKPVLWDRSKMVYDAVLIAAVGLYLFAFLQVAPALLDHARPIDGAILRMRALGSCAFLMLTVVLCIGPLARLDPRFLPLLYNRRHFGVLTGVVAAAHAVAVLDWYFAFSPTPPLAALLGSNTSYGQLLGFPFEALGIAALLILAVLAVTSHDFWMSFLTPRVWKTIHMSVYLAFALVVAHVALGYLQDARDPSFAIVTAGAAALVAGLHLASAAREAAVDRRASLQAAGWLRVGPPEAIAEGRARIVILPDGERAAVFRFDGKAAAISNVCAHQQGPLGEGRVLDGCVTCPWHGHQFRPEDGCAPAPFTDRVPIYRLKLEDGALWLDPTPPPLGTRIAPIDLGTGSAAHA